MTADSSCWPRSARCSCAAEHNLCELPIVNVYLARERARRGDRDDAIPLMRAAVDDLFREGQLRLWGIPATGVLVETLLDRGAEGDVAEAEAAIERLAAAPADEGLVIRDIWLLRLRALLARARGDARCLPRLGGIAIATWRNRLASKDTSPGPRRWSRMRNSRQFDHPRGRASPCRDGPAPVMRSASSVPTTWWPPYSVDRSP